MDEVPAWPMKLRGKVCGEAAALTGTALFISKSSKETEM